MSAANPSFAVLQMGARLHYAVPTVLERAGMLRGFYTDAARTGTLEALARLWPRRLLPGMVQRLFARELPSDLPRRKVHSVPVLTVGTTLAGKLGPRARTLAAALAPHENLRRHLLRHAFDGANALYVLDNADLDMVREARRWGLFVVYEQICSPEIGRILYEERERHPGIEAQDSRALIEDGIARDLEVWRQSDLVLSASPNVTDAIARVGGPTQSVREVPYGLDERWFSVTPRHLGRRILFVGRVGLPKGAHYFAQLARELQPRYADVEFRAIGAVTRERAEHPLFRGPNYVGVVPRDRIREEFARAYAVVLPTLSEGFGMVLLEAMACGVPVVTTQNSGTVARDGEEGFVLPIRDTNGLRESVMRLLDDPALRDRMGEAAQERARDFTWSRYAERLTGAIRDAFSRRVPPRERAA